LPQAGAGLLGARRRPEREDGEAFRKDDGDYIHQQGPSLQQLEHDRVGHVVASVGETIGPVAFSSLAATRDWLRTDYQTLGCWTPHVEITRPAFEAAVDVFQHAKLITKRHRYEDVVALEPPAA